MASILWHSCAPWACSGYGNQTATWTRKIRDMGHDVKISAYWGISGAPTIWEGMTVLPGFGQNYCSTSLYEHWRRVESDLVITLGDVWVMNPELLRRMPLAHWLPADCRPMSIADRNIIEQTGAQLIAMSRFGFERFKSAGYRPVYVPHGVDLDVFKPKDRDTLRGAAEISTDTFIIGINGANNDAIRKALPEQMLAFAKFHSMYPDSLLYLHTGVHQEGGQDLEAIGENLGIADCVRVVDQYRYQTGVITSEDMADWYNAIDVLSACSYGEGFGLPIVEAQACGTPVITTDASSMAELNPYGLRVGGQPFWNGVHKGWWTAPDITQMVGAFEKAYLSRGEVDGERLRDFTREYDAGVVAEQYMRPAVDELLERMQKRG